VVAAFGEMKLVVFAHTPPPFHGQSYMVKLMIDGLGGDGRSKLEQAKERCTPDGVQCFHVNARFSSDLNDVGSFQFKKILLLIRYCLEAIWCRVRYGADTFYYIPAPPKRVAFYRDCVVLLLCRPFFRRLILHWHATGLGEWLQHKASLWERWIAQRLLAFPDLSITLAASLSNDAVYFRSRKIHMVPNGIRDPCLGFEESVLPHRLARLERRREILERKNSVVDDCEKYAVVFLAHCTREKGLFDALSAIALANQQLAAQALPLRMHLTVAGAFLGETERQEFDSWQQAHPNQVDYVGFLSPEAKSKLLQESDCLCFPTYYSAEGEPVAVLEAMAFGLSIVATKWRAIPEMLPGEVETLEICNSEAIAEGLSASLTSNKTAVVRRQFLNHFTEAHFLEEISSAMASLAGTEEINNLA
jgi:glycosyltransferase involved in cell wall biosynthesis